jgi:hypothetical protein
MPTPALAALYDAVYDRLVGDGSEDWANRVHPDLAPSGTARPHVVYGFAAGGELNESVAQDAGIVLTVKALSLTLAEAFTLAGRISELLNDADKSRANALSGGAEWSISHCSQEQALHLVELVDGQWVYHEGARYRFRMERIA